MSEHHPGAWGGREEAMWWPSAVATEQHSMQQHFMHQQHIAAQQQQQQIDGAAVASSTSNNQQHFTYKMASSFQNPATTVSNATSTSPIGAAGIRGYDYSMTGGNPTMSAPAPASQWWYPPTTMENIHNSLQNMQNNMAHMHQQQNNMSSVHTPPPSQSESQSRQEEVHRQEVNRQHQEAVQRQQEAHHQALAEAHARQQLQQSQQFHLQNNHNNHQQHQQIVSQQPIHKGRMPRGKADARPRGRMTAYAFFVQTCREEHKKKHPEENVVFAEFSKKCAERWKTMLDKEKKRFHEMAENDKKRYDTEMQSYTPAKGEKQRGKKRKMVKDPNAPKRSLSAFFWFSNEERGKVKAQNPEYGVGDIAKELGRRWAEADAEIKGKYEALAEKDKARYEKELTAYKKKKDPSLAKPVPDADEMDDAEEDGEEEDDE